MPTTTIEVPAASTASSPSTRTNKGTSRNPPPLANRPVSRPTPKAEPTTIEVLLRRSAARPEAPARSGSSEPDADDEQEEAGEDQEPVAAHDPGAERAQQGAGDPADDGEAGHATVEVPGAHVAAGPGERGRDHGRQRRGDRHEAGDAEHGQHRGGERRAPGSEHPEHEPHAEPSQDVLDECHESSVYP